MQIQQILNELNEDCQISKTNSNIKMNHPCLLRHGIEVNYKQSFVACISDALYFAKKIKSENSKVEKFAKVLNIKEMKPIYLFDKKLLCGVIEYGNNTYYLDIEDKDKIINFEKKFVFNNESDIYPSFNYNNKRINYLEFLYGYKENGNVNYIFKNGNEYDLRKCNINFFLLNSTISTKFKLSLSMYYYCS